LPGTINGVKQYYPISEGVRNEESDKNDTIAVIRGFVPVRGVNALKTFLAGLVYASSNFDRDEGDGIEDIDPDKNEFTLLLKSTQGTTSKETTYTYSLTLKAREDGFDFEVVNIDCRYREKGIIPRTLRMEKLRPDKNERHAELISEFTAINSGYVNDMSAYIATRSDIEVESISKLIKGTTVEVGMNMDEVIILLGEPLNKRNSGSRVRWIYPRNMVIIFSDGLVSKIVE